MLFSVIFPSICLVSHNFHIIEMRVDIESIPLGKTIKHVDDLDSHRFHRCLHMSKYRLIDKNDRKILIVNN